MNAQTVALLREAAEWRLIGMLFERPGEGWQAQVTKLAAEISDSSLKYVAEAAREEAAASLYDTTFGPGGPAAPREVSYHGTILPGQLMGEIGAFYQAFAYEPSAPEAPDHVAVEAGFIAYLRLKQAYALERGDDVQAAVTAEAARRFIDDHVNHIAEPLAKSLAACGIRYLGLTADALLHRAGPRQSPPDLDEAAATATANRCSAQAGCSCAVKE